MIDTLERYSLLCDYFFRLDHPETPQTDHRHTSPVARQRALEVMQLLDLEN